MAVLTKKVERGVGECGRVFGVVVGMFWALPYAEAQSTDTSERLRGCYESDPQFRKLYDAAEAAVRLETSLHEAPVLFRLAYWSCPTASAKLSEALALVNLGRYMDAHAVLQPLTGSPNREVRDEARKLLADLDTTMDAMQFGNLTLRYSPAWAEVIVDGVPVTRSTGLLLWRLAPGSHRIAIRADSYAPVQLEITVDAKESISREVTLLLAEGEPKDNP